VAILIPTVAFNPARMLAGATAAAHAAGYAVDVLSLEGGAEARTERILELADSGQVEGILSLAPITPSSEELLARDAAIVGSSDFDDEMRGIGELADGSPVRELIARLADLGHRRVLHVAGSQEFASARGRRQTYHDSIDELGLESAGVVDGDWTAESGIRAVEQLDEHDRPTAIIAANDLVASGVIRGARDRGWRVPDDLSVTGWDNVPVGQFLSPSLTTVDIDLERLGSNAMKRLIASVRKESDPEPDAPISRIIWRESVGPAPTD
jgi:LacI family transcriptional regulator